MELLHSGWQQSYTTSCASRPGLRRSNPQTQEEHRQEAEMRAQCGGSTALPLAAHRGTARLSCRRTALRRARPPGGAVLARRGAIQGAQQPAPRAAQPGPDPARLLGAGPPGGGLCPLSRRNRRSLHIAATGSGRTLGGSGRAAGRRVPGRPVPGRQSSSSRTGCWASGNAGGGAPKRS